MLIVNSVALLAEICIYCQHMHIMYNVQYSLHCILEFSQPEKAVKLIIIRLIRYMDG